MADNPFLQDVQTVQVQKAATGLSKSAFPTQPDLVKPMAAQLASVAGASGASIKEIGDRSKQAMDMATKHGVDPSFGLRVGQSNTAFSSAWQKGGESEKLGFGGISNQQAGALDQELRLAAAKSPMANALGALHAMADAGVITPGKLQAMLKDSTTSKGPAAIMAELKKEGVDMRTAGQFMSATKANQEQVAKHNLQDKVRVMQGDQIGGIIAQDLAGNLTGGFRDQGFSKKESREQAQIAAGKLTTAMMADPSITDDPKKMADAATAAGLDPKQAAGAMQALKNRVMSDKNLSKAGNLRGLLAMHGGTVDAGDKIMGAAEKGAAAQQAEFDKAGEARKAQEEERGTLRKKMGIGENLSGEEMKKALKERSDKNVAGEKADIEKLGQLEEAGEVEKALAKKGGAGDVPGGKGGGDIKIGGFLTLLDNGQAQLEGQAGGAPGGLV